MHINAPIMQTPVGTRIHHEIEDGFKKHNALKHKLVLVSVSKAAFKLGQITKRMQQRDKAHSDERKKAIKDHLAKELDALGIGWNEISEIIHTMVEGLKNV